MYKFILVLLSVVSTALASMYGQCTGRSGICIDTGTCTSYGGTYSSGNCPGDPEDVKCCDNISCKSSDGRTGTCSFTCSGDTVSGQCPGGSDFKCCLGSSEGDYYGPCYGGGGACINIDTVSCETSYVSGKCPGGTSIKCCVAGDKPSWYINQLDYTETVVIIDGEKKSVSTDGCGLSSLSMGIASMLGNFLDPTDLFREANDAGYYYGAGFGHDALIFLGNNHGVSVDWTDDIDAVYSALEGGKGVIFHVGPENIYSFTHGGHYIYLHGAKTQNNIKKVYVFDPNGNNNYKNVLFALKKSDGGIEVAHKGTGVDFGILTQL